jgi:hypothetical protein
MELLSQILVWSLNFFGSIGIVLIVYGVVASISKNPYPLLESIANWVALFATLVGVLFTAISIYFPVNSRPPDKLSLYFTSPIVILAIAVALGYAFYTRKLLPPHVLNGFALLGIAGALFRLLSR